jgi:hypothetical protein
MLTPVKSWDEVLKTFREFQKIKKGDNSVPYKRFHLFYHWYYIPEEDGFAPSKFLGYVEHTIPTYIGGKEIQGGAHGGKTEVALERFFTKLDKDSKQFEELYKKLSAFAKSLDRSLCDKITNGSGGIHIPKKQGGI